MRPARRIPHLRIDIRQRDREMNINKVKIVQPPIVKGPLNRGDNVRAMERRPNFRDNKEIVPFHEPGGNGTGDTLATFLFVAVVLGTVEEAVTCFDGVDNLICRCLFRDFPSVSPPSQFQEARGPRSSRIEQDIQSEADLGHLGACGAKFDCWDLDGHIRRIVIGRGCVGVRWHSCNYQIVKVFLYFFGEIYALSRRMLLTS